MTRVLIRLACVLWLLVGASPAAQAGPVGPFSGEMHLVLLDSGGRPEIREGRSLLAVERPVTYRTHAGDTITVPAGMVTDLASIPPPASWFLPPDGPWAQIAVFHDLCYVTRGTGIWSGHPGLSRLQPYTRAECDQILWDGMADLGIAGWRRWAIYFGVRLGGAGGWGH